LLFLREREITDTLVELLISTVHRINARSEKKVVEEFVKDFKRVTGKDNLLRKIAEASLGGWCFSRVADPGDVVAWDNDNDGFVVCLGGSR